MSRPHKHAAVIKAWADGKEIEFRPFGRDYWQTMRDNHPLWNENTEYRVKPELIEWQAEREAHARGEAIEVRLAVQGEKIGWLDSSRPLWLSRGGGYEYRIKPKPHKWQAEMDAQARGEIIESSSDGGQTWMKAPFGVWKFDGDVDQLYRIKPKTAKTRLRVAAFGHPSGKGIVWLQPASTDEEAAAMAGHPHFICWLHDWKEIERPVYGGAEDFTFRADSISIKPSGIAAEAKTERRFWFGFDPARGDSITSIGVFYNYGSPGKPNPVKDQGK